MFYQENMYFILFSKFSNVSKCSSGWYYFHILYWISPKVTEYLNVSRPSKVQKFLSSVLLVIGQTAAARNDLDQSELRERPGSETEAGLWLLSFSTLRRSQPACLNYFYPQDVKSNGSDVHQQCKTSAGISDLWARSSASHLKSPQFFFFWIFLDIVEQQLILLQRWRSLLFKWEKYRVTIMVRIIIMRLLLIIIIHNISPLSLTLQQTSQWD